MIRQFAIPTSVALAFLISRPLHAAAGSLAMNGQLPLVTTIVVFVVVLVSVAAIGFRVTSAGSRRAAGAGASPVAAPLPPYRANTSVIAGPTPPAIGLTIPEPLVVETPAPVSELPPAGPIHVCPRCGLPGDSRFCGHCGLDLQTGQAPATAQPVKEGKAQGGSVIKIVDELGARRAAKQATWAALFCAATTALLTFLARQGLSSMDGISVFSLLDAVAWVVIGIAVSRMSVFAAVAALPLFLGERIYMWTRSPFSLASIPMIAVVLFCLVNGVRGTLAYQKLRGEGLTSAPPPQ